MAIIYECDGCGKTDTSSRIVHTVTVEIKSDQGQGEKAYQCCESCERKLRRDANPTTWVRGAPPETRGSSK